MTLFDVTPPSARPIAASASPAELDRALTAQIVVAWAGEGGEVPRLGWWRSDLVSVDGGMDLFSRLLPHTWEWAVLQAAREVARRTDAELRRRDPEPDRIMSLFGLGFELDERLDERLQDLKQSRQPPRQALPGLDGTVGTVWNRDRFAAWAHGHGDPDTTPTSIGRQLKGSSPASLEAVVNWLIGALVPLADAYPLPHFRRAK